MNFFPVQYQISEMVPHGLADEYKPAINEIIHVLAYYGATYEEARNILWHVLNRLDSQKVDSPIDGSHTSDDISSFKTYELSRELEKRAGVETVQIEPYEDRTIQAHGPAVVHIV